jgi:transposase
MVCPRTAAREERGISHKHTESWLRVEPLPAYAPELDAMELLWANLSSRKLANLCPETLDELANYM